MPEVYATNTRVCLKTAPDRCGRITGKTQQRAGRVRYEIDFGDKLEYIPASIIESVEEGEDIYTLIERGKYGSVKNLRMELTHIRLSGQLADVIYSMEASNTEFYAYQFKPVINFLNSPSNGLLIADEVGLGKTIEAGLIWTEMRARFDANRLLIIVPAVLREKWQDEFLHRFGVRADICNAEELLSRLIQHSKNPANGFAIICSLEGIRPPKEWDDKNGEEATKKSARARLMQYLSEHEIVDPLFDCVIADEAHKLKNPASQSHELVETLRLVSDNVILMTATPIQLKSLDLFYLLRLIDKESFKYESVFEEILRANAPILKLSGALRSGEITQEACLKLLNDCREHPHFQGNRQLSYMAKQVPPTKELTDPHVREALANRVDRVNLLAQVVNRTRKRFVHEHTVVRNPVAPVIAMTAMETEFYNEVTEIVREYCQERDLSDGFILTMPQRQMCSSIPAAYRAWTRQLGMDDNDEVYEAGYDIEQFKKKSTGPLVARIAGEVTIFAVYDQLYQEDSKYKTLMKQLGEYWKAYPGKKVILFSYYKETLRYLHERLDAEGIGNQLLYGGMKEPKQKAITNFQNDKDTLILLASEVASEGVDLQFASFLINYDLPWNPMKVEQRIGRIDRIGQKEDRILIQNYFYKDTLDDRIYQRLFNRLDIFQHALGDLEEILGDRVHKLTYNLLSHKMTAEQEEQCIQQTETAIAHIKRSQEELEEEAMHFAAHGDYVLNQVKAAREMKRYIQDENLWIYVQDFLQDNYKGCNFHRVEGEHLTVEISLSNQARSDLKLYIDKHHPDKRTRLCSPALGDRVTCIFSSHVDFLSGKNEIINQHHPLVRFVTHNITDSEQHPLVAVRVPGASLPEVDRGAYLFVINRWSTTGAKVIERLVYRAKNIQRNKKLSDDVVERIVMLAVNNGTDAFDLAQGLSPKKVRDIHDELIFQLDDEFAEYAEEMKMENEDRIDMMIQSAKEKIESQIEVRRGVIQNYSGPIKEKDKVIRMAEGRIRSLEGHLEMTIASYDSMREINTEPSQVMAGVVFIE